MGASCAGEAAHKDQHIDKRPFDNAGRYAAARAALETAKAASNDPTTAGLDDLGGWRWQILNELQGLALAVNADYDKALRKQRAQALAYRVGTPLATGGIAGVGAVVSAAGVAVVKLSTPGGWVLTVLGVAFALGGSFFSANTYVQNRNKKLRFLRLLYDLWDFAVVVLPSAAPADAYDRVSAIRVGWETAGG